MQNNFWLISIKICKCRSNLLTSTKKYDIIELWKFCTLLYRVDSVVIFFDEFRSVLVTLFESIGCFFLTLIKLFIPAVYGGDNFVCVNNIIIAFYRTVVKRTKEKMFSGWQKNVIFVLLWWKKSHYYCICSQKQFTNSKKPYNAWFFYSHK